MINIFKKIVNAIRTFNKQTLPLPVRNPNKIHFRLNVRSNRFAGATSSPSMRLMSQQPGLRATIAPCMLSLWGSTATTRRAPGTRPWRAISRSHAAGSAPSGIYHTFRHTIRHTMRFRCGQNEPRTADTRARSCVERSVKRCAELFVVGQPKHLLHSLVMEKLLNSY